MSNIHANKKLAQSLFDLANKFLNGLPQGIVGRSGTNATPYSFDHPDYGTIFLSQTEANNFKELIEQVTLLLRQNWDAHSIEDETKIALLQTLNANGRSAHSKFWQRKAEALKQWRETLLAPPSSWDVFYGVFNISAQGLPYQVGKVTFLPFVQGNAAIIQKQKDLLPSTRTTPAQRENLLQRAKEDLERDPEVIRAHMVASANTGEIAMQKALHEIRRTVDVLNFFADLVHGPPTLVHFPGEAKRDKQTVWAFKPNQRGVPEKSNVTMRIEGTWSKYALFGERLKAAQEIGFGQASSMLASPTPTDLETRIVTALRWAGRAGAWDAIKENYYKHNCEQEQAFLYYAICLESLFCKRSERDDITERLATRCARLLSKSAQERLAIRKDVKDLYNLRSNIVHEGNLVIQQDDFEQIRLYCRHSLIKMLTDPVLSSLQDEAAFEDWFAQNA